MAGHSPIHHCAKPDTIPLPYYHDIPLHSPSSPTSSPNTSLISPLHTPPHRTATPVQFNICPHLTCLHRIQEEEELAHSSADVEGVEGLLQVLELGQRGDQFQDVILQVLGITHKQTHTLKAT